jgi:hypothetical protein
VGRICLMEAMKHVGTVTRFDALLVQNNSRNRDPHKTPLLHLRSHLEFHKFTLHFKADLQAKIVNFGYNQKTKVNWFCINHFIHETLTLCNHLTWIAKRISPSSRLYSKIPLISLAESLFIN